MQRGDFIPRMTKKNHSSLLEEEKLEETRGGVARVLHKILFNFANFVVNLLFISHLFQLIIYIYIYIYIMFTYESLCRYIPFRIRNRRNRICFLHISRYLGPY